MLGAETQEGEAEMRLMLKFTIPVERGNEAAADGSLGKAIEALLERTKPEAAYFSLDQGERGGVIFFEETDPANLTKINEPFFAAVDAAIDIVPVLTIEDLRRGLD
jgi:hypothetical protein